MFVTVFRTRSCILASVPGQIFSAWLVPWLLFSEKHVTAKWSPKSLFSLRSGPSLCGFQWINLALQMHRNQQHYIHHQWNGKWIVDCSSLMHSAADLFSSPMVVCFCSFKMGATLAQLTATTFFLTTFSLKVYATCAAAWSGVFPMALKVKLLYRTSPSAFVDVLASPHFLLRSWMFCLFFFMLFLYSSNEFAFFVAGLLNVGVWMMLVRCLRQEADHANPLL